MGGANCAFNAALQTEDTTEGLDMEEDTEGLDKEEEGLDEEEGSEGLDEDTEGFKAADGCVIKPHSGEEMEVLVVEGLEL